MKPRRVLEDVLVPAVIVAPPPATVSQRTCLEHFGISKADYLRLVAKGAFPVRDEGQLRIAKYGDVEAYLTTGARARAVAVAPAPGPAKSRDPLAAMDIKGILHKAGFRKRPPNQ
jgi:hypothetical protein